jgi:hypothetical protein
LVVGLAVVHLVLVVLQVLLLQELRVLVAGLVEVHLVLAVLQVQLLQELLVLVLLAEVQVQQVLVAGPVQLLLVQRVVAVLLVLLVAVLLEELLVLGLLVEVQAHRVLVLLAEVLVHLGLVDHQVLGLLDREDHRVHQFLDLLRVRQIREDQVHQVLETYLRDHRVLDHHRGKQLREGHLVHRVLDHHLVPSFLAHLVDLVTLADHLGDLVILEAHLAYLVTLDREVLELLVKGVQWVLLIQEDHLVDH